MFSGLKVSFGRGHFGGFSSRKSPKFGQKNCLTNNIPTSWVPTFYVQ